MEEREREERREKGRGSPRHPTNRLLRCWTLQSGAACCIATAKGLFVGAGLRRLVDCIGGC